MTVVDSRGYLTRAYQSHPYMQGQFDWGTGLQVEAKIIDETDDHKLGQQAELRIFDDGAVGQQAIDNRAVGRHVKQVKFVASKRPHW